jgi:hypothetical protein
MSALFGFSFALSIDDLPISDDCRHVLEVPPSQSSVNFVMSSEYLSKPVSNNRVLNFRKWQPHHRSECNVARISNFRRYLN